MTETNAEIVRGVYEAFNRDDWDRVFRDVHPDIEVTLSRGLDAGTHRGRKRVEAVFRDQRRAFDSWVTEPAELIEHGDQMVVIIETRLRPKGTDAEIELRNAHVWTMRDGILIAMKGFPNPDEALRSVGLDP
jgi:ketosteroid isomerase-like protein